MFPHHLQDVIWLENDIMINRIVSIRGGDGGDVSDFQLHNFEMIAETKSENTIYIQLHCTCKLSNFITKKLNPPSFFEIITYELVVM